MLDSTDQIMIIAADHRARGALGVGGRALAMVDRNDLLARLTSALSRPGVDGLLASPDIVEDPLLLGALEEKVVLGSMNRGGLQGSVFELDDRFTGLTPRPSRPEALTEARSSVESTSTILARSRPWNLVPGRSLSSPNADCSRWSSPSSRVAGTEGW